MGVKQTINDYEIDPLDFLVDMLEQWRGWLSLGMICMLLVLGVAYYKHQSGDSTNVTTSNTNEFVNLDDAILGTNTGVAINYYVTWQQLLDSYDSSILMEVDATCVRRLNLNYLISYEETTGDIPATLYSNIVFEEGFVDMLSAIIGSGTVKPASVSELVEVTTSESESNNMAVLNIQIILPDSIDEEEVEECVGEYLSSISKNTSDIVGIHTISLISSNLFISIDNEVIDLQNEAITNIYKCKNNFYDIYNNLSENEKDEVNGIIASLENGELSYQEIRALYPAQSEFIYEPMEKTFDPMEITFDPDGGTINQSAFFNKKYAILGFLCGVFLYWGCSYVIVFLARRFRNEKEASMYLSIRSYGNVYKYPYRGVWTFFHDRRIYRFRHKKTTNIESISKALSAKTQKCNISKVSCLVLGNAGESITNELDEIARNISVNGVKFEYYMITEGIFSFSDEDISDLSPVLLMIVSHVSRLDKANELILALEDYNIPVIGMCFIEA